MSTFNEIEMTTPYGDTDNVLELNIDSSSDAYVLQNVIKLPSTYTFSIWYRTESDSQITFNVLGESETVDSTTSWNKFVKTVTVETLDETSIYIMPSVGVNSYFYEGYLVESITDTSWLPAPEDIEGKIGSVRSELIQTADSILARVSASDGRISTLETNLEGITVRVEDAEGNISKVSQTVDGVTLFIGDKNLDGSNTLEATMNGLETTVKKYTDDKETALEAKIQINADAISQRITSSDAASLIKQESEKISSSVSDSISGLQSQIEQDAESWKATFNKLGMYDEKASDPYNPDNSEKSCSSTLVTVDYDGLSVDGDSESGERIRTVIKNGIYGYNSSNENIFYLDQEGCHTGRVYMDRGFEAIGMKMVPTVINGVNTLCYVKIGGNS